MSLNVGQLQTIVANILQTTVSALVVNGIDLSLLALNNARRNIENAHDFFYSRTNLNLSISSSGGSLLNAFGAAGQGYVATGTLSPNITVGVFAVAGSYNGFALYSQTVSSTVYLIFYNGTAWVISATGFNPTNYWSLTTTSGTPAGTYTASGSYTGSPVLSGESNYIQVKRVQNVLLPVANGGEMPCEFLTIDRWNLRLKQQQGRGIYNATTTETQLGVWMQNPVCYQQGQTLFLVPPSQFSFPVSAIISVVQFLPDYTASSQTDFITEFGPEYLQWAGVLEANKLIKQFAARQEGNLDETAIESELQNATQTLLAWDASIQAGTTTPAIPEPSPQQAAA